MRYNAINFMSNRQIHKDLQLRVLKYIEYIHDIENVSPEKGLSVIHQISKNLQTQIFNDYYGKILMKEKNFALNFSKETIQKLTMKIKERLYGPGEVIFEQEEQDYRLFFLIKGECEFYQFNKGGSKQSESNTIYYYSVIYSMFTILLKQVIIYSQEPKFFGYRGFISGIPREMSCRSTNISHVFILTRQDLLEVLKEDPQDYEQFCKIRDQYLFYRNSLGESCFGCKKFGHTLINCPEIHLVKNKELVIFRNSFTQHQKRSKQQRLRMKYSTLQNKQNVTLAAQKNRLQSVIDLRKAQFQDETHINGEAILFSDVSDKKFSKMYPYIKFGSNEMIICDNYSFDELDEITDNSEEDGSNNNDGSQSGSSCETISEEEDQDQSKDSENTQLDIKEKNVNQQHTKLRSSLTKNIQIKKSELLFLNKQNKSTPEINSENFFSQGISDVQIQHDDFNQHEDDVDNQNNDNDQQQYFQQSKRNRSKSQNMLSSNNSDQNDKTFPSNKLQSILRNKDEQILKPDNNIYSQPQQVRINSKTVVHNNSGTTSRKKSRNITDSPLFPRVKTKRQSDVQEQNLNQSPFIIMKGKQSFLSKNDNLNINLSRIQKDESINYSIKDEKSEKSFQLLRQISKKQKSSTFVVINIQRQFIKYYSQYQYNQESNSNSIENKTVLQRMNDKEFEIQIKKDPIFRFYEKQNQQLHQIILNLIQKTQKKNHSFSHQQKEIDTLNQDLSVAKSKKNHIQMNVKKEIIKVENEIQNPIIQQQTQIDTSQEQQSELFIFDFDVLKEFTKYLPHNNATIVCQNVKAYQDRIKKLRKYLQSKGKQEKGNIQNGSRLIIPKLKQ